MRSDTNACLSYCDRFSPCREAPLEEALGCGYFVSYTMQKGTGPCVLQMRDAIPLDALQHPVKLKPGRYHDAGLCIGSFERGYLNNRLNLHVRRERTSQAIPDASHTHLCIVNQLVSNTCQIWVKLTVERKDCDNVTEEYQVNQMRSSKTGTHFRERHYLRRTLS